MVGMELRYDDATKERLRYWRDNDRALYEATERQLKAIKADPRAHGRRGTPYVPRLIVFGVPGRDEEYVVTWDPQPAYVTIVAVGSVSEMQQRARLNRER